jgi:hypothetical protein
MPGGLYSRSGKVTKGFSSFFSFWPLNSKSSLGSVNPHQKIFQMDSSQPFLLYNFRSGRWNSLFLFFRKHLKWSVVEYSRYTTILGCIGVLSQYIAVPALSERLKLHDSTISLLDAITRYLHCYCHSCISVRF